MQFRDLRRQYEELKEDIDKGIEEVIASSAFISGPSVKELEKKLQEYVGVKHAITCANGTDALTIALMAWNVGEGDAVFVPDFTFFSSGECPAFAGATPVFVDVDSRTFNIDPVKLEEAIKKVQADGDISTTSFFPAKPLGCYGDGGAIFTDNDEWAALIRSICVHGKSGNDKYNNIRIGMNSRLDTIQAAILLPKLKAFADYELDAVNKVAKLYTEKLADSGLVLPLTPEGFVSSWAQYTVQLSEYIDRASLQAKLKEKEIPSMVYYAKPMHLQGAFEGTYSEQADCSVTEKLCKTVLSLPMHPYLSDEEIEFISSAILNELK